jgi:hypothetical protein
MIAKESVVGAASYTSLHQVHSVICVIIYPKGLDSIRFEGGEGDFLCPLSGLLLSRSTSSDVALNCSLQVGV